MVFHTFGDSDNKTLMLIHGLLTPWQIWEDAAEYFSREYFVVVPELDAHTEDEPSTFESIEDEAEKIREYALEYLSGNIAVLCGLSMGGRIAADVAAMPDITVDCLVLDGAPLIKIPRFMADVFKRSYEDIVRRSKKRDHKVIEDCKKNFLPERYLDDFLKIADNMDVGNIGTILYSVYGGSGCKQYDENMRILYMHGTKSSELFSRKAAADIKKMNPQTEVRCFEKYAHAQLACFEIEKWIAEVERFLRK